MHFLWLRIDILYLELVSYYGCKLRLFGYLLDLNIYYGISPYIMFVIEAFRKCTYYNTFNNVFIVRGKTKCLCVFELFFSFGFFFF